MTLLMIYESVHIAGVTDSEYAITCPRMAQSFTLCESEPGSDQWVVRSEDNTVEESGDFMVCLDWCDTFYRTTFVEEFVHQHTKPYVSVFNNFEHGGYAVEIDKHWHRGTWGITVCDKDGGYLWSRRGLQGYTQGVECFADWFWGRYPYTVTRDDIMQYTSALTDEILKRWTSTTWQSYFLYSLDGSSHHAAVYIDGGQYSGWVHQYNHAGQPVRQTSRLYRSHLSIAARIASELTDYNAASQYGLPTLTMWLREKTRKSLEN
jgi:hypothetical protein